ncbi:DNA-binding transcriptional MocR family regulator [Cryobacterium sp. CAN_C3]|uniref:aminotransferase class I/II-fold pyridoxal phosphate-dependent enzyme n=1 Tax=unclassified Cryobacterium TaxID=2649013 RepID=UPI0018CB398D|nr:aminotransferase class I/II-fold pyridoxal phosphate-dependent enzyme [Cryobacterium sp. CAN_C3]MEC5154923.1 DNA-binding transcriptional MocR family regulator [Cryobacterium sp. CAN_C3]
MHLGGSGFVPDETDGDKGWDETALLQILERSNPQLGYLMPDFHNPTGRTMPIDQRERVVAAAARQGTVLIVDETIAEPNIDRKGTFLPCVASAGGSADTVVTVGSVGKAVWGGLRVGCSDLVSASPMLFSSWQVPHVHGGVTAGVNLGSPLSSQLADVV